MNYYDDDDDDDDDDDRVFISLYFPIFFSFVFLCRDKIMDMNDGE